MNEWVQCSFLRQSHLCAVMSGWTNGLNVVKMRHPWYEVNCQISLNHWWILILYPAVTNSLKRTRQVDLMTSFSQNCKKVWFPEKVFYWLVMSHIGSILNIFAGCSMFKLSRQVEHVVPGKNIEEFPDKRLMTRAYLW